MNRQMHLVRILTYQAPKHKQNGNEKQNQDKPKTKTPHKFF
jgi:hypothetical protein